MTPAADESPRLLLVDDEPDLLEILSVELEDRGYRVVRARNGQEALSLASGLRFHVVVTDFKMPGMDGIKTLAGLHALDPDLRGILMTGFVTSEMRAALQAGGWLHLVKPFQIEDLIVLIDRELRSRNGH